MTWFTSPVSVTYKYHSEKPALLDKHFLNKVSVRDTHSNRNEMMSTCQAQQQRKHPPPITDPNIIITSAVVGILEPPEQKKRNSILVSSLVKLRLKLSLSYIICSVNITWFTDVEISLKLFLSYIIESDFTCAKFYYQMPFISSSELCSRI